MTFRATTGLPSFCDGCGAIMPEAIPRARDLNRGDVFHDCERDAWLVRVVRVPGDELLEERDA